MPDPVDEQVKVRLSLVDDQPADPQGTLLPVHESDIPPALDNPVKIESVQPEAAAPQNAPKSRKHSRARKLIAASLIALTITLSGGTIIERQFSVLPVLSVWIKSPRDYKMLYFNLLGASLGAWCAHDHHKAVNLALAAAEIGKHLGPEHMAKGLQQAAMLCRRGPYPDDLEYEALLKQALSVEIKAHGNRHQHVVEILDLLSAISHRRGDNDTWKTLATKHLAASLACSGLYSRETEFALKDLYEIYSETTGAYSPEGRYYKKLLDECQKHPSENEEDIFDELIQPEWRLSRVADVEKVYKDALCQQEKNFGPRHPNVALVANAYACYLRGPGQVQRAETLEARADSIWQEQLPK